MENDIDQYFLNQEEPNKSCLIALSEIILAIDENLNLTWKYRMPMICYKKKMFCYLWTDKKTKEPYIGVVEGGQIEHPLLEQGNRSRMKILRVNPNKDIPIDVIYEILKRVLIFYN